MMIKTDTRQKEELQTCDVMTELPKCKRMYEIYIALKHLQFLTILNSFRRILYKLTC